MKQPNTKIFILPTIIIVILILLSLFIIIPYIITIIFPNLCYGCTKIGKLQQTWNNKYFFEYINWMAYLILFLYFIYRATAFNDMCLKYTVIFICIVMIFSPLMPLLNIITIILSAIYENPPFIKEYHTVFPASIEIEKNAQGIIDEYREYMKKNGAECIRKTNPGFIIENTTKEDSCWRGIYLKRAGVLEEGLMTYSFPITTTILKDDQIHTAFFSILDPGVDIPAHTGYYKGYIRYHLGVEIPNNNTGNTDDKAFIVCGGEKYIWKEGEGVVFDDMYLHYVKNPTGKRRVVLYLDVKRKSENPVINAINNMGIFLIDHSPLFLLFLKNQHNQNKIEEFTRK